MKKQFILAVACLLAVKGLTQNFRYFKPGQKVKIDDQSCLVIRNDLRTLIHLGSIDQYKDVKALKLSGFNDGDFDVDSILSCMEDLSGINYLIFDNCDLNFLPEDISHLSQLKEIRIVNGSVWNEDLLFDCLKQSKVERLFIQTSEPELNIDSLPSSINTVAVSSDPYFLQANKTDSYIISVNGSQRTISVSYFGKHFRSVIQKQKPQSKNEKASFATTTRKFDCIQQPIPGIKINDTVFTFRASEKAEFTYASGSRITITPNSFVTETGQPYIGPVKLFYREFRNPVEIMLSGIPMTNKDNNGETKLFRSGGMYEVNATDNRGRQLNTTGENGVKIRFVVTDTASDFGFYSLNNDGSWSTLSQSVAISDNSTLPATQNLTKAVRYFQEQRFKGKQNIPDTTGYYQRYKSHVYCYTYRKDNQKYNRDSLFRYEYYTGKNIRKRTKSLFRVKYLRTTKEKEIVYTIIPSGKDLSLPRHIQPLVNKTFVYTGKMSLSEFRKTFSSKLNCWDLRPLQTDNEVALEIKTGTGYVSVSGIPVHFKSRNEYVTGKKTGKILNSRVIRVLNADAREFNKRSRYKSDNYNETNYSPENNPLKIAWEKSKKLQNEKEKAMSFREWLVYVDQFGLDMNSDIIGTEAGTALVESGLGIKNIDCYIHSGEMENILVRYKAVPDAPVNEQHVMLYKNINTSYPLRGTTHLDGYFHKKGFNYVLRFSGEKMQVTKPATIEASKSGNRITLTYTDEHNVKGLSSAQITNLIFN